MIIRQILHPATGCASYIFGCTGKKALAVVDPHAEHIDDYLAVSEAAASPIVAIVETRVQADHLSGAPALAERTGSPIYLHEAADVTFPHRTLRDSDELELGAAMVYPTFLAAIADVAHPSWRASAVGVYRLWRDLGYAVGAILAGVLADLFGASWAIAGIAALTFASGAVVFVRMRETLCERRALDAAMAPGYAPSNTNNPDEMV